MLRLLEFAAMLFWLMIILFAFVLTIYAFIAAFTEVHRNRKARKYRKCDPNTLEE